MEFIIGEPIQKPKVTNEYKLIVNFDDGDSLEDYINDKDLLELLITTYEQYKRNLNHDWNSYCEPDEGDIFSYFLMLMKF